MAVLIRGVWHIRVVSFRFSSWHVALACLAITQFLLAWHYLVNPATAKPWELGTLKDPLSNLSSQLSSNPVVESIALTMTL